MTSDPKRCLTPFLASALKWQANANALNLHAEDKTKGEARLKLYQDKKPYRQTEL